METNVQMKRPDSMRNAFGKSFGEELKRYLFMIIGCISYSLSTRALLDPNNIIGGGVSGASLLLEKLTQIPYSYSIFMVLINVPILILGFKLMGWKFILNCFITTATLSATGALWELILKDATITDNKILAAAYSGILQGIGIGLFIKYEMSSGGTELLGRLTHHVLPFGTIATHVALFDGLIVAVGAFVLNEQASVLPAFESIMYVMILIVVSAKVSDLIVFGLTKARMCYIITEKADEIAEFLITHSPRGVTKVDGQGMYSKTDKGVLMTCIKSNQVVALKLAIKNLDENAFVIVCDANEVYGKGFTHI